jgi:hypothetical protein
MPILGPFSCRSWRLAATRPHYLPARTPRAPFRATSPLFLRPTPPQLQNDIWAHVRRELDNFKHDLHAAHLRYKNGSLELSPVDFVMGANVAFYILTTISPPLEFLFRAGNLSSPFPLILSGLCPVSFINMVLELGLMHFVTRPMTAGANPRAFAALFVGGTFLGAVLVGIGPGSYMGPIAGMAAIWSYWTARNPTLPVHVGLLGRTFEARQVMGFVTLLYFLQLLTGSPSAAAYVGGACWGVLFDVLKRQKILDL